MKRIIILIFLFYSYVLTSFIVKLMEYYEYLFEKENNEKAVVKIWGKHTIFEDCNNIVKLGKNNEYFYGENIIDEKILEQDTECKKGYFIYSKKENIFITGLNKSEIEKYIKNKIKLDDSYIFIKKKGIKNYW